MSLETAVADPPSKGPPDENRPPLLSIITVTLNCKLALSTTLDSLRGFRYDRIELIVVDGGSTDGTLDIIRDRKQEIARYISEPDKGIYDAMNKGLDLSRGDAVLFLNAGDTLTGHLEPAAVGRVPCLISVRYTNFFGRTESLRLRLPFFGPAYCHQGMLFPRTPARYNLKYRISADYDYYLRVFGKTARPTIHKSAVVVYDNTGFSQRNLEKRERETTLIILRNFGIFPAALFCAIALVKWWVKILRQSLRS